MNPKEIIQLIKSGESEILELKESFNKEAVQSISAFANTKGGTLLIGINASNEIVGTQIGDESIQNYMNQIKQATSPSIFPDIETILIDGKAIIIISVDEFPVKPISYKGRYYKRVQNSNHVLNLSEISNMHMQSLQLSWDAYEYPNGSLSDIDIIKVNTFIEEVNSSGRFYSEETVMDTMGKLKYFLNANKPSNAAMLLFAKEPLRQHIRVGRFKDDITIIDDRQISLSLFEAADETLKFIKTYLQVAYEFDGNIKRNEKWNYPIQAIKEIVLNAIVHRDYTATSDIQIKIYDDKITIFSPGKLYGDLTLEQLKRRDYQSSLRNKLVAEAFYLIGEIEKYGSGLLRVEKELESYPNLNFTFDEIANGMLATFEIVIEKSSVKSSVKGSVKGSVKSSVKIIEIMRSNKSVTIAQLSARLNISHRAIEKQISNLKKKNLIERIGPVNGGYWKVFDEK